MKQVNKCISFHRGFSCWCELPIWALDQPEDHEPHEGSPTGCRAESTLDGAVPGVPHARLWQRRVSGSPWISLWWAWVHIRDLVISCDKIEMAVRNNSNTTQTYDMRLHKTKAFNVHQKWAIWRTHTLKFSFAIGKKIQLKTVTEVPYLLYYSAGAQSCNQMGYSKVCQRSLQPGGQVHRRVLWLWALSHQSDCRGAGPGEGIFATSFRKTWQLGKWSQYTYQTLD